MSASMEASRPPVAAVVFAAGLGLRLRPLTDVLTKALLPINNVPLLDRAIARTEPHVDRVMVNAHHQAERVIAHVAGRTELFHEPVLLGTAGTLGALRDRVDGAAVLATNADAYLDGDLDDLVTGWNGESVRLLVHHRPDKPDFGPFRYSGSCLLPWEVVKDLRAVPGEIHELYKVWFRAWDEGRVELVESGPFFDCGTPQDYLRANLHASGGTSVIAPDAVVQGTVTRAVVLPGSRVRRGERLVESIRAGSLTVPAPLRDASAAPGRTTGDARSVTGAQSLRLRTAGGTGARVWHR